MNILTKRHSKSIDGKIHYIKKKGLWYTHVFDKDTLKILKEGGLVNINLGEQTKAFKSRENAYREIQKAFKKTGKEDLVPCEKLIVCNGYGFSSCDDLTVRKENGAWKIRGFIDTNILQIFPALKSNFSTRAEALALLKTVIQFIDESEIDPKNSYPI